MAGNWDWLRGAGSIAAAYGAYKVGKEANDIEKEKNDLAKKEYDRSLVKDTLAQANLDSAMDTTFGATKKKKKKETSPTDLTDAYSSNTVA